MPASPSFWPSRLQPDTCFRASPRSSSAPAPLSVATAISGPTGAVTAPRVIEDLGAAPRTWKIWTYADDQEKSRIHPAGCLSADAEQGPWHPRPADSAIGPDRVESESCGGFSGTHAARRHPRLRRWPGRGRHRYGADLRHGA